MRTDFLDNCGKKEAMCRNYQVQAELSFRDNGGKPCEDQCKFLQQAADLEFELAQITVGAERAHHEREKQRLDAQIRKIRSELDGKTEKADTSSSSAAPNDQEKPNEDDKLFRTVRTWYKEAPNHSFADVSGMAELKKRLKGCIDDIQSEELMKFLRIRRLNSFFFIGPPGCGKTFICEAFAHELMKKDYKYISILGSDIISRYVGDAEKLVTRLFEEAEKNAPCIVFIDEIDSLCKNRSLPNLPEYAANITTSFLTGYNRINSSDAQVTFIAATNYPDRVDSAMLDRVEVVEVPLPDNEARLAKFRKDFEDIFTLAGDITYQAMADATESCNYRDIGRITNEIKHFVFKETLKEYGSQNAAIEAIKSGEFKLCAAHFEAAVSKINTELSKEFFPDRYGAGADTAETGASGGIKLSSINKG